MVRTRQILLGIIVWSALWGGGWVAARREMRTESTSLGKISAEVLQWMTDQRTRFVAESATPIELIPGTPVLMLDGDRQYRQVGVVRDNFVRAVAAAENTRDAGGPVMVPAPYTRRALVSLYDDALQDAGTSYQLTYFRAPTSLDWVVTSLLPPDRRDQIAELITAEWKKHQEETLQSLRPVMQESVQRAIAAIQAELPAAIERHRSEFAKLGERYKAEILQTEIVPLVEEHVLPIVEREALPLMNDIGRVLWDRVSLWSFAWRYFYDKSPLPERHAVKAEFDRFVESEALPELRGRSGQFVQVIQKVLSEVSRDPVVSATVRRNLRRIAMDPELHKIVWSVVQESVLQNKALRTSLDEYWNSAETRAVLERTTARFEPTARAIGDLLIGSREQGITPEMARVLRLQILLKDRHWLLLEPIADGDAMKSSGATASSPAAGTHVTPVRIQIARDAMVYPIHFDAAIPSPLSPIESGP